MLLQHRLWLDIAFNPRLLQVVESLSALPLTSVHAFKEGVASMS